MGNQKSVACHFESVPDDVLIDALLPVVPPKYYHKLHLVCSRTRSLLIQWAHKLPKIHHRGVLRFKRDYCIIEGRTTRCLNFSGDSLPTEPSLTILLRHYDVRSLTLRFDNLFAVTDTLLNFLQTNDMIAFRGIDFNKCDLQLVTENGLRSFLSAVSATGCCEEFWIWVNDKPAERIIGPPKTITDGALQPIIASKSLERFFLIGALDNDADDLLGSITDQTLDSLAKNFPQQFSIRLTEQLEANEMSSDSTTARRINALSICNFIHKALLLRQVQSTCGVLEISGDLRTELRSLLPAPDEETYFRWVYRKVKSSGDSLQYELNNEQKIEIRFF